MAEFVSLPFISHANEIRVKQMASHEMGANNGSGQVAALISLDTGIIGVIIV